MKQLKAEDDEKYGELYRQKNGNYYFVCFHCGEYFQLIEKIINHIETILQNLSNNFLSTETEIKTEEEIFVDLLPKCDDYNDGKIDDKIKIYNDEHIKLPSKLKSKQTRSFIKKAKIQLTCDYCMNLFDRKSLEKHMFTKHFTTTVVDQPFVCNHCEKVFETKHLLNRHKKNVHNKSSSNLMCDICVEKFPTKRSYLSHIRKKHTKYKCEQCDCQYNQKRNLLVHCRQKHLPENERPSYTCTECGRSCMTNALLQDHIRIHHTNEKPYICKICDARFATRTYLCQHRSRIHFIGNSISKPQQHIDKSLKEKFQCSTCGQISYYRKCYKKTCYTPGVQSSTNRPLRKRNVTKSHHSCTDCGKLYLRRDKFEQHMNDCMKKLECQYCHKLFKNRKSYNSHIIDNHNESKIRPCRFCDMIFKKHWQRYAHEKKHKIELGLIDDGTNLNDELEHRT